MNRLPEDTILKTDELPIPSIVLKVHEAVKQRLHKPAANALWQAAQQGQRLRFLV
jgi:hypothetical protein